MKQDKGKTGSSKHMRLEFWQTIARGRSTAFQTFDPNGKLGAAALSGKLRELDPELSKRNKQGASISMAINRLNGSSRKNEHVRQIVALFIDDDSGTSTAKRYLELPCPPHLIVNTSPGKFHVYWLVSDCAVEEFSARQSALAEHFGTDRSITDPCRAMRLPGSLNWKMDPPFLATLLHNDRKRPQYTVEELFAGLSVPYARRPASSAPERSAETVDWQEVESALASIQADDRNCWLSVGMALHSTGDPRARIAWDSWSKTSEKYEERVQSITWAGFRASQGRTVRSIFHLAKQGGWAACTSDEMSFAELFATIHSDRLRFDPQFGVWYRFDGVVWVQDSNAALQYLHDYVVTCTSQNPTDSNLRKFRTNAAMKSVIAQAQLVRSLHVRTTDFDRDESLIAVRNGVLDLRTGAFRAAAPQDLLRRQMDVAFDPQARAPEWNAFLKRVCCGDREFALHLLACAGYTLFGHAREQKFFFLRGSGANGKGVFTRLLKRLLGTYAVTISPNVLSRAYSGNPNSPSPALAQLAGARMFLCPEGSTDGKVDDAFLKQVTGGDELAARFSYGEMISFVPVGKLWITTNKLLRISRDDEAMWRRMIFLPFDAEFRGALMDTDLEERLWGEEAPGILNTMVRAAVRYNAEGMPPLSSRSSRALRATRRGADPIQAWIENLCTTDPGAKARSHKAYGSFVAYAEKSGLETLGVKQFSAALTSKGFQHGRDREGAFYRGLTLDE